MASEPDPSVQALIERLITMPLFASFSTTRPDSSPDNETTRIVLINPLTQGMVVIGGNNNNNLNNNNNNNFDFTDLTKSGQPPATQASIDGLERREVKCSEEIERLGGECVICMEEWSVGDVVSEMPCKHKYHRGCVEKWLKIHGSCPVCRFKMPVDDNNGDGKSVIGEESGGRRRGEVWVTFAFGRLGSESESLNVNEEE